MPSEDHMNTLYVVTATSRRVSSSNEFSYHILENNCSELNLLPGLK